MYRAPYEKFAECFNDIRAALIEICKAKKYEDAAMVPAMMAVTANLSVLSENTDEELVAEFRNCLLDARTRALQVKTPN